MRFSNISVQSWKSTSDWNSPPALRLGRARSLLCCVNNPQSVWLERTCEGNTNFMSPLPSTSNNRHTVSFHLLQWEQPRSGQDSGPGQPPWLTSVEFTQHFSFFSIFSSQVGPAINFINCWASSSVDLHIWVFLGTINHVINSADEENNCQSFLVQNCIWNTWLVSSGDENFCGSKMVSAMKNHLLTFPLEIDLHSKINLYLYFKTA